MIGPLCITDVSKFIHPITIEAAKEVASNQNGSYVYFTVPNGKTAGMAGVGPQNNVWMLCTPAIHEYPITFTREAKRWVESRTEPYLWNILDERNTVHLKLLKFLGFKFLQKKLHGPNQLSFIEFCRVRTRS